MSRDYDVFISYAHEDSGFVEMLAEDLAKCGLRVWRDTEQIVVGDYLYKKLQEGLSWSKLMVCIVSEAYLKSAWCEHERVDRMYREVEASRIEVLPILLDDSPIREIFPGKIYCDFRDMHHYHEAVDRLLDALFTHIGQRSDLTPYFDNTVRFNVWTPQRASVWYSCRKQFWYEFIAAEVIYGRTGGAKSRLKALKESRAVRQLIGYKVRAEMKRYLRGWADTEPGQLADRIRQFVRDQHGPTPTPVMEFNNGIPVTPEQLQNWIERGVERYRTWRDSLASRYSDSNGWSTDRAPFYSPRYQFTTPNFKIDVGYTPFAWTEDESTVLFLENRRTDRTSSRAKRRFRLHALALSQRRSKTAREIAAQILFLDDGVVEEMVCEPSELGQVQRETLAIAERYHRDRVSRQPIQADLEQVKCRTCKYLSVCHEGLAFLDLPVSGDVIPREENQTPLF